jgi:rhamnogalacturonan endolyase
VPASPNRVLEFSGKSLRRAASYKMLFKLLAFASVALLAKQVSAAFGITTSTASYVIDAGSSNPLKFTVSRTSCDITSINFYGSELQYQSTGSHIGSGLGSATVTATTIGE